MIRFVERARRFPVRDLAIGLDAFVARPVEDRDGNTGLALELPDRFGDGEHGDAAQIVERCLDEAERRLRSRARPTAQASPFDAGPDLDRAAMRALRDYAVDTGTTISEWGAVVSLEVEGAPLQASTPGGALVFTRPRAVFLREPSPRESPAVEVSTAEDGLAEDGPVEDTRPETAIEALVRYARRVNADFRLAQLHVEERGVAMQARLPLCGFPQDRDSRLAAIHAAIRAITTLERAIPEPATLVQRGFQSVLHRSSERRGPPMGAARREEAR